MMFHASHGEILPPLMRRRDSAIFSWKILEVDLEFLRAATNKMYVVGGPSSCLEYILVHEMVHLLERHHNERFQENMDRFLPQWRVYREELSGAPLPDETWSY